MWNPFKRTNLEPVISTQAEIPVMKNVLKNETEVELLQSMRSRNEVTMLYERLANEAFCKLKGGGICPDS